MNGTNGNEPGYPENALVPYPVIVAATRAILSAFARFPWLQTQLLENVRLMRVLSQHYGKYRASGRALRDKIISLSSQCRRSSFLKQPMEEAGPSLPSTTSARSSQPRADEEAPMEPMQVCFSHQTAFQVLRAIDARELAGSGDTAWRLPARAPSARGLEEVVKRIENDRPGLSIERPVHILLGAACVLSSSRRQNRRYDFDTFSVLRADRLSYF